MNMQHDSIQYKLKLDLGGSTTHKPIKNPTYI